MKSRMSVTLDRSIIHRIESLSVNFKSRSEFIEVAVQRFITHLDREESEQRDIEILNSHADKMNEEAEDVLGYQVLS